MGHLSGSMSLKYNFIIKDSLSVKDNANICIIAVNMDYQTQDLMYHLSVRYWIYSLQAMDRDVRFPDLLFPVMSVLDSVSPSENGFSIQISVSAAPISII